MPSTRAACARVLMFTSFAVTSNSCALLRTIWLVSTRLSVMIFTFGAESLNQTCVFSIAANLRPHLFRNLQQPLAAPSPRQSRITMKQSPAPPSQAQSDPTKDHQQPVELSRRKRIRILQPHSRHHDSHCFHIVSRSSDKELSSNNHKARPLTAAGPRPFNQSYELCYRSVVLAYASLPASIAAATLSCCSCTRPLPFSTYCDHCVRPRS